MGIVSFAQNFEDVLLNRVFASVHYAFYVDIGAYHPVNDSVTKTFYDRGWDGLNIEPGAIFDELAAARPRDINLRIAVYDRTGTISFAQHPGWYAGLSHVQAEEPAASGRMSEPPVVETRTVPCDTLTNIVAEYAGGRPIAFLKIDAEGAEANIVHSTDWRAIRPTVILIEATKPRSNVLDNDHWEPALLEQGYLRAYFDGINCFYVPEEHSDLLRHFELPVNVLDGFRKHDPNAEAAEVRLGEVTTKLAWQTEQAAAAQQQLNSAQALLGITRQSLDALLAKQNDAVAALVEANAYQLADLRRQLAELEATCASLRQERDVFRGFRDEAMRLRRLTLDLEWPDGPGALRSVLPLARLLRRGAGTRVPAVPAEEFADTAPGSVVAVPAVPAPAPPGRRSLAKRAVWLMYRPFRPVSRPAAQRLRAFITLLIHSELRQLDDKLDRVREEVARLPMPSTPGGQASDPRLAELQNDVRQFGKLLEDTLLTLALEHGAAPEPAPRIRT